MASLISVSATFGASIKSVGTAVTMSAVGFYLHQREFISKEGKRALALMSQQVTFPLYFFTKIIYCNQDWSDEPCPDVTSTLSDTWILLFWPIYMVMMGLLVGHLVNRLTNTPKSQGSAVLASTAFANNTALPITLLTVIHANFPSTSDLGRIDPTLFLSVYLVVYPIIQWSLGGWILAPSDEEDEAERDGRLSLLDQVSSRRSLAGSIRAIAMSASSHRYRNVINNKDGVHRRRSRTHGLSSTDEGTYLSELDLESLEQEAVKAEPWHPEHPEPVQEDADEDEEPNTYTYVLKDSFDDEDTPFIDDQEGCPTEPFHQMKKSSSQGAIITSYQNNPPKSAVIPIPGSSQRQSNYSKLGNSTRSQYMMQYETDSIWETIRNILDRTLFQPPVIGSLLGILCAVTPARGYFVDLVNRHSGAPLQWLFDGLYKVGQIAVPDNMLILGCNISASYNNYKLRKKQMEEGKDIDEYKSATSHGFSRQTMIGIAIGKMLVMPVIGITTTYFLEYYVLDVSDEIAGAFYLVLMIVFLTPTANNVMIMIELADCDSSVMEGVANTMILQYAIAPVILSLTMTVAIGVASQWS